MPARRSTLLAAGAVALALTLAGCGGDDESGDGGGGDRPTVGEVADALPGDLADTERDCLAEAFVDSDISDEGLRAVVDAGGLDGAGLSPADTTAIQTAAAEGVRCSAAAGAADFVDEMGSSTTSSTTAPG